MPKVASALLNTPIGTLVEPAPDPCHCDRTGHEGQEVERADCAVHEAQFVEMEGDYEGKEQGGGGSQN